jgi:hypothetical protein
MAETRDALAEKAHVWIYSLWYPAILGSMIVGTAVAAFSLSFVKLGYAVFFLIYFTALYGESVDKAAYTRWEAL